jgi:hypothetical protein
VGKKVAARLAKVAFPFAMKEVRDAAQEVQGHGGERWIGAFRGRFVDGTRLAPSPL